MRRLLTFACLLLLVPFARADGPDTLQRDIPYETIDGTPIKLDVAIPKDQGAGPFPLIVCIHGGAWRIGDKSKFTGMIESMARHGYVAASINYRFAPRYRWPAQLDDAKAAVHFLKRHATEYRIDVDHVGATGESAGSQLAMLLAFEPDPPGATTLTSVRMKAIVNYYGPADLSHWDVSPLVDFIWRKRFHESLKDAMEEFLGTKDPKSPKIREASPITYVDDCCPPVLTFHGTLDPMVPYHQAELLHAALRKCGVVEQLVPIPNGLHGGWARDVKAAADEKALAFFDAYLKPGPVTKVLSSGPAVTAAPPPAQPAAASVR
jgi:acetyl esterase/lipase